MSATKITKNTKPTLAAKIIDNKNWTPIPNWFLDRTISDISVSDSVKKVFLFLYRKTVGWNKDYWELSNSDIENGADVTTPTAIRALVVVCECWNLFHRAVGRKGGPVSGYRPNMELLLEEDDLIHRQVLTEFIYDSICPTHDQLKDLPPAAVLYKQAEAIMGVTGQDQKNQLAALLQEMTAKGKSLRDSRRKLNRQRKFQNKVDSWCKRPEYETYTRDEVTLLVVQHEDEEKMQNRVQAYNARG